MINEKNLQRVHFLEGERIFITPRAMDDFDDHYRWNHDRELVYLNDNYFKPESYERAREQFEERLRAEDCMCFSIILKENGEHIGLVEKYNIVDYERKGYLGIVLKKPCWRQGYRTEAAHLMLAYIFDEPGSRRLKSYTHMAILPR
ncbi:MAG: GNAT family N-acetyltransferase [Candidatus Zixiibacteriota bacterium]|nr:MAG: GNAT family N-acetyltransferase [candidate division Zixibacteria bacterium]